MSDDTPIPPVPATEAFAASADPVAANLSALQALFPQVVAEGKVDVDALRALLGEAVEEGEERYGLTWSGKARARRHALTPTLATLRPDRDGSVEWDTTRNLMIEGDNLEVLKCLAKSYAGRVKLIYIDPPYNTGKDFVYPDDYAEPLRNYLRRTGQVDGEGVRNTSNPEGSGRFHTDWLNMMYPRLMLAREMLSRDGHIFISIDYHEVANLKSVMDGVFGEYNLVNVFSWVRTRTPAALSKKTKNVVEYIVCYQKDDSEQSLLGVSKPIQSANTLLNQPNKIGELTFPNTILVGLADGAYMAGTYGSDSYPVELVEDIEVSGGKLVGPIKLRARFRWSQAYLDAQLADGVSVRIATSKLLPSYEKSDYGREAMPNLISSEVGVGTNENASNELSALMGVQVFDYPKPTSLISYILNSSTKDDLILDFFAGSGTTGHAVMAQNAADGGNRRFILVQLPEPLDPANKDQKTAADFCDSIGKPRTIAELTKERLRRAGAKVRADNPQATIDTGFRAYGLAASNLKVWQPGADLTADLLDAADNLIPGRTEDDLLTELLLKRGIDLAEPAETLTLVGKAVHVFGGGVLVVCLSAIAAADAHALGHAIADRIEALNPAAPAMIFFRDTAFDGNVARLNLEAILMQRLHDRGFDPDGKRLPELLEEGGVRSI